MGKAQAGFNPEKEQLRLQIDELAAQFAGKHMPKEAKERWAELNDRFDDLEAMENRLVELYEAGAVESSIDSFQTRNPSVAVRAGERDAALWTVDRHRDKLSAEAGDRLDDLIRRRDPTGVGARYLKAVADPDYDSAFGKIVMHPTTAQFQMTAKEQAALQRVAEVEQERLLYEGPRERAMSLTGSAGGFAVPFELDATVLLSSAGVVNPLREISRVTTIAVDEWRGLRSDGVVASFAAEATEATDNSPTFAQPTISTEKAQAYLQYSIELGMDWPGLRDEMAVMLADAKNVLEATKYLTGTGTNEPGGILNIGGTGGLTTAQRVQTDVAATLDVDDFWDIKGQLASTRFYGNSTWVMNPGMGDRVYRFTPSGSTTEPQAMPDRSGPLMGRPVSELSTMVNTTTTGSRVAIFGDWQNFRIIDRIGLQIELLPLVLGANRRPTGERGIYAYWRTACGAVVPTAFRYLEVL